MGLLPLRLAGGCGRERRWSCRLADAAAVCCGCTCACMPFASICLAPLALPHHPALPPPARLPAVRVKRNSLHLPPWTWITPPPLAEQPSDQQQQQQHGAAAAAAGSAQQAADGRGSGSAAAAAGAAGQPLVASAAKGAVEALLGEDGRPDLELMERVSAYPATKSWGRADTAPKVGWGVELGVRWGRKRPACSAWTHCCGLLHAGAARASPRVPPAALVV